MAVDGDTRQVVPDYLVDIIEVHLVQLLGFLLDADGQGLRVGVFAGPLFGLGGQGGGAGGRVSRRGIGRKRRWRGVVWRGGLGKRGRGETSRSLLDDGHVRDDGRLLRG